MCIKIECHVCTICEDLTTFDAINNFITDSLNSVTTKYVLTNDSYDIHYMSSTLALISGFQRN